MSKLSGWYQEIKDNKIINVQMNILNKCTSRCKSCRKYTWPNDIMSSEDVKNTLKVLKEKFGLNSVVFSGGDPILYNDFIEVANCVKELGINYSIISTLITNKEEYLKELASSAYRIHVSVDSVNAERYKEIRGVNGLEIAKRNIEYICSIRDANKVPIRISSTISKMNYTETLELYKYAKKVGCLINFYFLHTWDDLKMSNEEVKHFYKLIQEIAEDERESKKVISNAKQILLSQFDFTRESERCKTCYLPLINATINANGDIYPCCRLLGDNDEYGPQLKYVYGNVCGKTEEEIEHEFNKRLKLKYPSGDVCKECGDRYNGVLQELEEIKQSKRKPLFL